MATVQLFTTGWCPYCNRAKALLKQRGVTDYEDIDLDAQPAERDRMVKLSGRTSVPQIFINGTHIGGCDDLMALDRKGALVPLLQADAG
ncbi:MAG: grxC 1 [Rhizobacter sp.]|nr:grxC 1 [Rhizobacter sp.]